MNTLEIICESQPWFGAISVWFRERGATASYVAEPLTMRKVEVDGSVPPATLTVSPQQAQQFMDALWQCGLRPTEGSGSAGSLAATERHLADMRALVFKTGAPK